VARLARATVDRHRQGRAVEWGLGRSGHWHRAGWGDRLDRGDDIRFVIAIPSTERTLLLGGPMGLGHPQPDESMVVGEHVLVPFRAMCVVLMFDGWLTLG
jgi:hypothetical protein